MKKIIKLITFFLSTLLFTSCCLIDYSEDIKKVAIPMQKELESFYTKNKRLPTVEERDVLLEKVGCKIDGNICIHNEHRIKIITFIKSYNFRLKLRIENTGCLFGISKSGYHTDITCGTKPCIKFGQ